MSFVGSLVDRLILASLLPLAIWILLSGLDDLFLDLVAGWDWLRGRARRSRPVAPPDEAELARTPERRFAILVPTWNEYRVIGQMLEHNLNAIRYHEFDIFVGAYPNDDFTVAAIREVEDRFPQVHLALCPHPGPTCKADCLNWVYQRMLLHEERRGVRYDVVVVHDSEDLVHPEELRWLNYYTATYGMVQIPVLPLPTPAWKLTHGVYCDEFAEYQTKDMPVRKRLGGFIPSNGVGTGYARWALEKLAESESNRIFQPSSLTEDYENGLRLHQLGCSQLFVPLRQSGGTPVATREYFPQRLWPALKQRTRWVTGITLQAWERYGWQGGLRQAYWFWRDRKGLAGNLITVWANFVLLYGGATWVWSRLHGGPWGLGGAGRSTAVHVLLWATLFLLLERMAVRAGCVARWYGWKSALATPVRVFWANGLNAAATGWALGRYAMARLRHQPLVWMKTEHEYPNLSALTERRTLGEILLGAGAIPEPALADALASKPSDVRLGEHLLGLGLVAEDDLYRALSLQHSVPFETLDSGNTPLWMIRALPAAEVRKWKLVPFRVSGATLYVGGTEVPTEEVRREVTRCTGLEVRFHFITPTNLRELMTRILGRARAAAS